MQKKPSKGRIIESQETRLAESFTSLLAQTPFHNFAAVESELLYIYIYIYIEKPFDQRLIFE